MSGPPPAGTPKIKAKNEQQMLQQRPTTRQRNNSETAKPTSIMDRKAPPQAIPEEDSKLPAVAMTHDNPSKRRKINTDRAVSTEEEVVDVAAELRFQPGDRIEVKWTINDDDDSEGEGQHDTEAMDESEKFVTVWWAATLCQMTDKMHTLTYEERQESEGAGDLHKSSGVKVPIYRLNYAPLEGEGHTR